MKKEIIFGLFGIVVVGLLTAFFLNSYGDSINSINSAPTNINTAAQEKLNAAAEQGATTLDTSVIAKHNTPEDCWLLIDQKVYGVSSYLSLHPGGRSIIIPFCGKDATTAFGTKAGQGSHSSFAVEQLASFYIGDYGMELASVSNPQIEPQTNTAQTTNSTSTVTTVPSVPTSVTLDVSTVARHDNSQDCWLIINNGVYDVTSYLVSHPGGRNIIIPFCGKDATTAFATQAGQGSHSSFATNQLAAFSIGSLGSTTTVQDIQTIQENSQNIPPQPSGEDDNEDEGEHEDEEDEYEYEYEYEND